MKKSIVMENVINAGLHNAPYVGFEGGFYAHMFVDTRNEWKKRKEELEKKGNCLYDEAYDGTGNNGPIGMVIEKEVGNYVYLYLVNAYGDWVSQCFTHKVIAG